MSKAITKQNEPFIDKVLPSDKGARTIVYIGGTILGLLLVRSILRDLGVIKSAEEVAAQKRDKTIAASELATLRKQYKATLAEQYYSNAANVLYNQLGRYSWIDDDEEGAIATIKTYCRNPLDFALVQYYYGLRQNINFGIPVGSPMNLTSMLKDQLNEKQYTEVKNYLNSIGVTI